MAPVNAFCNTFRSSISALFSRPNAAGDLCIESTARFRFPKEYGRFHPLNYQKISLKQTKDSKARWRLRRKASDTAVEDAIELRERSSAPDQAVGSRQAPANRSERETEKRDSLERLRRRRGERQMYLLAAIASSSGITFLAAGSVYYRFVWHMQGNGEAPILEMFCTFSLAVGAAVGMELWARWAHRAVWHASLWHMHESHHRIREGQFELNDIFAIINAVPAIALLTYGFFNTGIVAGLCYGAGLGITIFGIAYMFVHDGLVHKRFPVGPIAKIPYFQKVAAAHQLHHADLFGGVPYGLFLGPKELEQVGGQEHLEKLLRTRTKAQTPCDTHGPSLGN